MQSNYLIDQNKNGFVVRGRPHRWDVPGSPDWLVDLCYDERRERREVVTTLLKPYCLDIVSPKGWESDFGFERTFGLFEFPNLVACIAAKLMGPWQPPVRERD